MTGGRFEPYRVAETYDHGQSHEAAESWADGAEPWGDAEAWDYDEARASPEAYDQLELRLMDERADRPQFTRFRTAMADFPEVVTEMELLPESTLADDVSWLQAVRTGRFWANAVWLTGAACAGVLAGLVSTNFVALALNPEASNLLAAQVGGSRPAISAPAPSSMTAMAGAAARAPAPARPDAAASELAGLEAAPPLVRDTESAERPMAPLQVAALVEPEFVRPELAPTRPATDPAQAAPEVGQDAGLSATPPSPAAMQLAGLVEPAPGPREPAPTAPTAGAAPPAAAAVEVPADPADREPTPMPPPAATEARAVTPPAVATPAAPAVEYRVQLAMLRDKQNVKYVWHDFIAQFGPAAKGLHRYVFPTQTAHGTRHLVQVGPFGDEDHAEAMCSKLKQRGGDCLVVRQSS